METKLVDKTGKKTFIVTLEDKGNMREVIQAIAKENMIVKTSMPLQGVLIVVTDQEIDKLTAIEGIKSVEED